MLADDDLGVAERFLVERELGVLAAVRVEAQVVEQAVGQAQLAVAAEEAGGDDLVGVEVRDRDRHGDRVELDEGRHASRRTSVSRPVTAAAAAIAGLIRWVRAPGPWRPWKLRLEVEAQRSPGATISPLVPRHMEQPA